MLVRRSPRLLGPPCGVSWWLARLRHRLPGQGLGLEHVKYEVMSSICGRPGGGKSPRKSTPSRIRCAEESESASCAKRGTLRAHFLRREVLPVGSVTEIAKIKAAKSHGE